MYDVCVSIVTTNEKALTERCLKSFYEDMEGVNLSFHGVIVDNHSNDGVESLAQMFPQFSVIQQTKNRGFGASHNRGFRSCDARYFFILNPDTFFQKGQCLVSRLYRFMEEHDKVGIVAPKLLYPDGSLQYSCRRFPLFLQPLYSRTRLGERGSGKRIADHFFMKDFDHASLRLVDWVLGSAMLVRTSVFNEIGGFDERFWMYVEDTDLCRRVWEAGHLVYFFPEVALEHALQRLSAKEKGVIPSLMKNRYAWEHLSSWLKYFWKWRGTQRYYLDYPK